MDTEYIVMEVHVVTRVLILSDSHGLTDEVEDIKRRHQLKYMIHCGDSELDSNAVEMEGFFKVAGNCDYDSGYPDQETFTIGGLTFLITHGHLYHVKTNLMSLAYRAKEVGAQVICFGHTHVAGAQRIDKQLFINPGSIRLPKGQIEKTYAIMEWVSIDNIKVNFYSTGGEVVESLAYRSAL